MKFGSPENLNIIKDNTKTGKDRSFDKRRGLTGRLKDKKEDWFRREVKEEEFVEFKEELDKRLEAKAREFGLSREWVIDMNDSLDILLDEIHQEEKEFSGAKDISFQEICEGSESLEENAKENADRLEMSEKDFSEVVRIIEKSDFEKTIKEKAEELKIDESTLREFMDRILRVVLSSHYLTEDLKKDYKGYRLGFDDYKEEIFETLDNIQKDEKTGGLRKEEEKQKLSKYEKFEEFVGKHQKVISLSELALYLSSYGATAFNFLVNSDAEAEIHGEKISLKDLVDNLELMKEIDQASGINTPIDILQKYHSPENFIYLDDDIYFHLDTEIGKDGSEQRYVSFNKLTENGENIECQDKISLNDFLENKEQEIKNIAEHCEISHDKVEKLINSYFMSDVSKISVVELDNFKVNKDLDNLKFENLKEVEKINFNEYGNKDKFEELFLECLEKEGYSLETLKEIAEDNPKEVIKIISEVIGENVEYDWVKYLKHKFYDLIGKELGMKEIKSKGMPYVTLEKGKGLCYDYTATFVAGKYVLTEKGVPNLENFVALATTGEKLDHQWNAIATVDSKGTLVIPYTDSTWADPLCGDRELNAVDKEHYYNAKLDEAHKEALKKIRDWNSLVKQEKLKEILTQYDPKLHKRDRKIRGNKKLYEVNEDIEITPEGMDEIRKEIEKGEGE